MIIVDPDTVDVIKELPLPKDIIIVDVKGEKTNPVYTYKIPVKIDLRYALRANVSDFSIKLLNKPFSTIVNTGFLDDKLDDESSTPSDINRQVNNFSEKNMIKYFNSQNNATLSEFNIDFKEILNKQIMSRFENYTDEELFGNEEIIIVGESADDPNNTKDLTTELNDPNANIGISTFEQAVDALYQEGGDPASAIIPMQDELSFEQSAQGLTITDYSLFKSKNSRIDFLKETIKSKFLQQTAIETSSGNDLSSKKSSLDSSRLKTFRINKSLREQEVNFYIDVDQQTISETGGMVHLVISCYNMFGLILDMQEMNLRHSSFSEDLSIFLPDLKVEATRSGVNKDIIVLEVANNSFANVAAKVYYKVTSECGSLDLMRFKFSQTVLLRPKESKRLKYSGLDREGTLGGPNTGGSVLFRVTPMISTYETGGYKNIANTYFASLKSRYLERNVFIPIMSYNRRDHIEIELHSIPKNVSTIQIVKRNVTYNERTFNPIKDEIGSVYPVSDLSNNKAILSFEDYDIKDEITYEYKVKIIYGSGEKYTTINSAIVERLDFDDFINLDIDPVVYDESIGANTLNVNVVKSTTPADKLFDQIAAFAKQPKNVDVGGVSNPAFELFKNQLNQISSTILEAVLLRVTRFNTVTGEMTNIGEFNVEFNQSSSTEGSASIVDTNSFSKGQKYIYSVKPYIRTVYDLLVNIKSKLMDLSKQTPIPGRNLVAQLLRTTNQGIISSTGAKFYSRMSYKKGTLQSEQQSVEQVNGDLWLYGRNGNIAYREYSESPESIAIVRQRVTMIKAVENLAETYESKLVMSYGSNSQPSGVPMIANMPIIGVTPQPQSILPPPLPIYVPTFKTKSIKKSIADRYINDIVKIQFTFKGDTDAIDYFVITCIKNGQSRAVGSIHCPDNKRNTFTYIDSSQIGYQGAINYVIYCIGENKSIKGPYNLGLAIVGSGV
jgi:hypothetical protein